MEPDLDDGDMIGIGLPPIGGEVDAAYTASVIAKLKPAWWMDWRHGQLDTPGYVPMLYDANLERVQQTIDDALFVSNVVPYCWLIYNEPERADQANATPEQAANTLTIWLRKVPSWYAPCAVGGVNVSVHHGGKPYLWLDAFLGRLSARWRKHIDYWHIHVYGDTSAFYDGVMAFRKWMQRVDMVRPVIVSECGTDRDPAALMALIRHMLREGDIDRAAWFSSYYDKWNDTGLLDEHGELTSAGKAFVKVQTETHLPLVTG